MSKKQKVSFDTYFSEIYTKNWPKLRESLSEKKDYVKLENLSQPYFIDAGSTLPPLALGVEQGDSVLDMCAAPGGKSLQLACVLSGSGHLQLNELSRTRRDRLKRVVDEHLPEHFRQNIKVTGFNAERMGMEGATESFDKILLDAPCSSERHVLENTSEFSKWTPSRTKNLAIRQMAMLCAGLELLKPGGIMVYSTCSISPIENEKLIQKFIKKRRGQVECVDLFMDFGEAIGEVGWMVRPDRDAGRGPMYLSKLKSLFDLKKNFKKAVLFKLTNIIIAKY